MDWNEYVDLELRKPTIFDNAVLSMGDTFSKDGIPPIVLVSISVLNNYLRNGGRKIVFVLPEGKKLPFLFLLCKLVSDAFGPESEMNYDPSIFTPGAKVKFENCIVEFVGIEKEAKTGVTRICVKTGDGVINKLPVDTAPFFQQADTKLKLTKDDRFSKAKQEYRKKVATVGFGRSGMHVADSLKNNITHFSNSLFSVVSPGRMQEYLQSTTIDSCKTSTLFYFGKIDDEGNIVCATAGQYTGIPAFAFGKDLYSIAEAILAGNPAKLVFIDGSDTKVISSQLDALDTLLEKNIPIIYTTDTAHSFELEALEDRGFDIWRWDKDTITDKMVQQRTSSLERRILYSSIGEISYQYCEASKIEEAVSSLLAGKPLAEQATSNISVQYVKLLSLAFRCLRQIRELSNEDKHRITSVVNECVDVIRIEGKYNPVELITGMRKAADALLGVVKSKEPLPKVECIKGLLLAHHHSWKHVCFIIADDGDKTLATNYWQHFILNSRLPIQIRVSYQDEFSHDNSNTYDAVLVYGWITYRKMQEVLFSNLSKEFWVILYKYETRWQAGRTKWWRQKIHARKAGDLLGKALPGVITREGTVEFDKPEDVLPEDNEDIGLFIQQIQYKSYLSGGGSKSVEDTVEVIPISFIGNCFGFFKKSHELIDVTDIVLGKKSTIRMTEPEDLNTGSFIVVREASKDIIRELADEILANSGLSESRSLAKLWKTALEMEKCFTSEDELVKKIQNAGCKKSKFTILQWIRSEERIIPQDKEDLLFIGEATEDQVLLEKLDTVFEAGKDVQRAHLKAGQALSSRLKKQIASILTEKGIDPYNIWDPITLSIEEVGVVKVLKIIDKGSPVRVDVANVNRIIEEF